MTYKVGIKKWTLVMYEGEKQQIWNDFWTTVDANDEFEAKRLAEHNLLVKMAKNSFIFGFNVKNWKNIELIDLYSDLVIG